jgi:hypothetical protein
MLTMTTYMLHRRRAERFAQLLDEANGGRRHHVRSPHDENLAGLLALGSRLATLPDMRVDPEFRDGLRAMLIATGEREGIGTTAPPAAAPPLRVTMSRVGSALSARGTRVRTVLVAGIAAGTVAFAGISTASSDAIPGDALYPVKRSAERAQLALASSDIGRGQLYLDFARVRLDEARSLHSGLDRVLADMDADTSHGVRLLITAAAGRRDTAALDAVDAFAEDQGRQLTLLYAGTAGPDADRVLASLDLLDAVSQRSHDLRDSLDCGVPAGGSADPLPRSCGALPAPAQAPDPAARPGTGAPQPATDGTPHAPEGTTDTMTTGPQPTSGGSAPAGQDGTDAVDDLLPTDDPLGEADEPATDGDGGVLGGIGRLLGSLLG